MTLSGNKTKLAASINMREFSVLKAFKVDIHPPKAPFIKEVIWVSPPWHWIKCNTSGASINNFTTAGGIFKKCDSVFLTCFAQRLGVGNALFVELLAAMIAIEITNNNGWKNL